MYIQRFIASWLTAALVVLFIAKGDFTFKSYAENVNILIIVGITAAVFIILTIADKKLRIRYPSIDDCALAVSLFTYAAVLIYRYNDFYFYIGVMCVLAIACIYLFKDDRLRLGYFNFPAMNAMTAAAAAAVFCGIFISVLTVMRYLTYSTPNFDFGIFVNMFHNMKETLLPVTTCERDKLLSHFAVHISPIYYLILPFYCLFPSPVTLQISQAVIVVSAVIPLFLLAGVKGLSPKITAVVCIAFCFYPALSGGCFYDIHENCFLVPLIMWMFYFYEKKKYAGLYIFAVLILLVKEDASVYVAFAAIYLLLDRRDFRHGILLLVTAAAYFFGAVYYLNTYGEGIMATRYSNYITGGGLESMLINLFRNPALMFSEIFNNEKVLFILQMLFPIAFLPLVSKRISRLSLLLPIVLVNLMPDYKYQHSIYYQYTFGVTAFFFYAAVINLSEMTAAVKRTFAMLAVTASVMMFNSVIMDRLYYIDKYKDTAFEIEILNECLENIPDDASVQASTFLVPKLAQRSHIYEIDSQNATEYLAIDLRYEKDDYIDFLIELYQGDGYEIEEYHENIIVVMQKTE